MKKILITGGAGFIGSNFVHYILAHRDYQIVNLDALTYAGNLENLKTINSPQYTFVQGDVADREFVRALFEKHKFDSIIHFAAETHVDRSIANASPFINTNIIGTYTLLEIAREFDIQRYHQISTDEVYGDLGEGSVDFFTEKTPIHPHCPYAAAKASADILVSSWHDTYNIPTIITRCSNNYGPYQFPEKLIPFLFSQATQHKDLTLYGDGKNVRDWLYVEDHCEAILTAFENSPFGEVWNIGGHNEKTNIEIAEIILQKVPQSRSKITFIEDRKAHDRRYAMDATKIEKQLNWKPKHRFEDAIEKTIHWYQQNQDWVQKSLSTH